MDASVTGQDSVAEQDSIFPFVTRFVSQNVIGYLPTIDAPASGMATVHEIMVQSLKINGIR